VLDVRVKRCAELSTDPHLVACNLRLKNPMGLTKACRTRRSYRISGKS